ncbi:hypothetical protein ASC95_01800 [Pelomonas sp. Root1217]|uniref:hypothetical protein n=1 Tax=Pelomonas sp. Root1217 TaxID=1736430 RepID=UPI00070D9D84|nr:hypothetical protein [Pelomonas sp. Root1217]KQV60230.1 hypothetical protein ASC95_01800 [Pelomonas sp. Root1217]
MNHRWIARGLVGGLHLALLVALWLHRPPPLHHPGERRVTTVRLLAPRPQQAPPPAPSVAPAPRKPQPELPEVAPLPFKTEAPGAAIPAPAVPADPAPAATAPAEPPRTTLRLTLPPGYAASSAAARNPALSDPRSNTARPTFEDRIGDATGGAGAWVEESTSENRSQAVGALGDRRTVMRRGNTCVEIFRSRIADMDQFNGSVAPRAIGMVGKPYKCK